MAITQLPMPNNWKSQLGRDVGSSLSEGLKGLAEAKLYDLHTRREAAREEKIYEEAGFSKQQAAVLRTMAPKEKSEFLSSYLSMGGGGEDQGQVEQQAAPKLVKAQQVAAPQMPNANQQFLGQLDANAPFSELLKPTQQKNLQNVLGTLAAGKSNYMPQEQPALNPEQQIAQQLQQEQALPGGSQQIAPISQQVMGQGLEQAPLIEDQVAELEGQPKRSKASEIFRKAAERKEKIERNKEAASRFKETKEERKEILQSAKDAKNMLHDLDRMEELEKTGKLDTPGYIEALKRSGLDIAALKNPESEEFGKIQQGFMKNAKAIYGGRISNSEMEQFLSQVPSLSMSPQGRQRVIAGMKRFQRGILAANEARKEIMKENDNIPPYDLLEQIDDKIGPKLDKISEQFKKDLSRPVPKGQNKYITGLQAAAGSIVGGAADVIKHAGGGFLGALVGSRAGKH
jgi:hypothetical protein